MPARPGGAVRDIGTVSISRPENPRRRNSPVPTRDDKKEEITVLREEIKRLRRTLSLLTPGVDVLLKRRGFRIYKKEPAEDLLIPDERHRDEYYEMLNKYSFRLFLRDVIKHQDFFTLDDVTRYASPRVTRNYLEYLSDIGLAVKVAGDMPWPGGPSRASARRWNGTSPKCSSASSAPRPSGE